MAFLNCSFVKVHLDDTVRMGVGISRLKPPSFPIFPILFGCGSSDLVSAIFSEAHVDVLLDGPDQAARGIGLAVCFLLIPFIFMGWCLCCCAMGKTTTDVMAGISFVFSILTALFTVS